jgi:UDP-N-acetylglucosamine--N-acetylmuramyl-(pentapeptide) pyrophosphoryl-undecaprenol N-acetylglucosamine transferase
VPPEATPKVLIATGHTGGHLFPALCFAEQLGRDLPCEIRFLMTRPKHWETPRELGRFETFWMGSFALPRGFAPEWILFPFKLLWYSVRVFGWIIRWRPRLVVGFGSFSCFPAVVGASVLGIPSLLHEQNVVPGKATRFLAPLARRVALSFPPGKEMEKKFIVTGNPIREELIRQCENILYFPPRESDKLNVLVVGGSQGARRLNQIVWEAFRGMRPEELARYRLKHLTGTKGLEEVSRAWNALANIFEREVIGFTSAIGECLSWSHLVIARAGAGTVFELLAFARPSILVPYPHAEAHQAANARFLVSCGAAEMHEEAMLKPETLRERLRAFRAAPERLKVMAENAKNRRILDASRRLSHVAQELLERK